MVKRVVFTGQNDGNAGIGQENFSECGNFEQWAADASSRESAKVFNKENKEGDQEHQPQTITLI